MSDFFTADEIVQSIEGMTLEHGTKIVLNWSEFSGATTVDVITGETRLGTGGALTPKSKTIKALSVHFVQPASSVLRLHAEVEVGDCIVDFPASVSFDGLKNVLFLIAGEKWVQKKIGDDLAKSWDAIYSGQKTVRSFLLSKAQ